MPISLAENKQAGGCHGWARPAELYGGIFRVSPYSLCAEDQEKTAFVIGRWLHCYKVMPVGLKTLGPPINI